MSRRRMWQASVAIGIAFLGVTAVAAQRYHAFLETALGTPPDPVIFVERGMSVAAAVGLLERSGMTRYDWRWRLLMRMHPVTVKAGEYRLSDGMRPAQVLDLLASGKVLRHRFTIVEGWRFIDLVAALAGDPVLVQSLDGAEDPRIGALFGETEPRPHPEGWFLPETYLFVRGDRDFDILERAHRAMREALAGAWDSRDAGLPLDSPYDLLILASIVEKETALAVERPDIAGVFTRRLQQRWRLETDPTVIYGLGKAFDGDLRRRDLEADTPYNTYTRYGLPPTPISLPGVGALQAVAHPAPGTAMFFVADGSGGHVFSDTLADHNRAVRKLLNQTP